jgi:arylsulfatase A-like enzyme
MIRIFKFLLLVIFAAEPNLSAEEKPKHPNVLIIVADDLGWADVGYHGAPFPTPNIDALCKSGVELDRHYVSPTCTPTRTALLTGRYPSRFGNNSPTNERVLPWDTLTLASMFGESGYRTAITGKWHLGSKPEFGPRKFGFDRSYGSLAGGVGPYNHLYKGGIKVWHRDDKLIDEEGHVTDLIAEEAVRVITEPGDAPFFLYVPFTAVHDPFDEPEKYLERVKHIPDGRRQYAASAVHMDEAIGSIIAALEQTGKSGNTLIIFFSDNGGTRGEDGTNYPPKVAFSSEQGSNLPLRGWKRTLYEGGIRVPAFAVWPTEIKQGTKVTRPLHAADWMPTLAALIGYEGTPGLKWDGLDMLDVITGKAEGLAPRLIYCRNYDGRSYVSQGKWKLIIRKGGGNPELFDVIGDPFEKSNVAGGNPNIVVPLQNALIAEAAKDDDALPKRE